MRPLVIIGAGGFGRETLDTVEAINSVTPTWEVLGVVDDSPSEVSLDRLEQRAARYLGSTASLPQGTEIAVAVGSPAARRTIVERLGGQRTFPSLIHPTAVVGWQFRHGSGLIVLGGVSIGTNVSLCDHVHLNAHAVIGHDACVASFVSINPNATVSGEVHIGVGALVGAGACILQGRSVGDGSTVGAGACVTQDVSPVTTVVGVPATPLIKEVLA